MPPPQQRRKLAAMSAPGASFFVVFSDSFILSLYLSAARPRFNASSTRVPAPEHTEGVCVCSLGWCGSHCHVSQKEHQSDRTSPNVLVNLNTCISPMYIADAGRRHCRLAHVCLYIVDLVGWNWAWRTFTEPHWLFKHNTNDTTKYQLDWFDPGILTLSNLAINTISQ